MVKSPAERQRARRLRQKAGKIVLPVEVDDVALTEALIESGFLDPEKVDDRHAISRATSALLEKLSLEEAEEELA